MNVSLTNVGNNTIQLVGTATAPGFTTNPSNRWASANIGIRFPKSICTPAPNVGTFPSPCPEVTNELRNFNALNLGDAVLSGSLDLCLFSSTDWGLADDGYWYISITSFATGNLQNVPTGSSVILYQFTLPSTWQSCSNCVELLASDVQDFPISMQSSIVSDNSNLGPTQDGNVINIVNGFTNLPLKLVSFDGKVIKTDIQLNWITENEINTKSFEIERSFDGINFENRWDVSAQNNSIKNEYSYIDYSIINYTSSKYIYYRLKMINIDGSFTYSNVVKVSFNKETIYNAVLYPNEVSKSAVLSLTYGKSANTTLNIFDMNGELVQTKQVSTNKGLNLYNIDVSFLRSGMYNLSINSDNFSQSLKLIKL